MRVTPFSCGFLVCSLLLSRIYMKRRCRVAAGWWLLTAAAALALVAFVHFLSGEEREAPIRDIFAVYGSPVWGLLALVVLYGLVLSLAALFVTALRAVLALRTRV